MKNYTAIFEDYNTEKPILIENENFELFKKTIYFSDFIKSKSAFLLLPLGKDLAPIIHENVVFLITSIEYLQKYQKVDDFFVVGFDNLKEAYEYSLNNIIK
jgi:hypothetical protein